jgi:membrane protein insertase Oxa1/YidC/SpoIIIJ
MDTIVTARSYAQQWLDQITSSSTFSNPTVIAIMLITVLVPLLLFVESLGKGLPAPSNEASRSSGAMRESDGNKKDD